MKFSVAVILNILLGYTAFLYSAEVPWWAFAIGSFLTGVAVPQRAWRSWLSAFCGMLLCWGAISFYINQQNNSLFASKMALLFPLGGNPLLLVLVTALAGALVGAFAALSGAYLRYE